MQKGYGFSDLNLDETSFMMLEVERFANIYCEQ